jgi:hypothetical protein
MVWGRVVEPVDIAADRRRGLGARRLQPCRIGIYDLVQRIQGAGIADDPKGPLFRTIGRGTGL